MFNNLKLVSLTYKSIFLPLIVNCFLLSIRQESAKFIQFRNFVESSKTCLIAPKFKIYIVVNITAKSLEIVIYIILRKISKVGAFSITKHFFVLAVVIFICIIPIIKLDEEEF